MEKRELRRPCTQPNLLATTKISSSSAVPTKLLLNVTMLGSFGPVQVVMSNEATVADLIAHAVRQYAKEGCRPVMPTTDPAGFDLHYSQFCLQCLERDEKLVNVWSRNLLLCPNKVSSVGCGRSSSATSPWLTFKNMLS